MYAIEFGNLSAMLLDFVDHTDGFLYLRLAGAEPVVNAIWAKLSAREGRGKKWGSEVAIPIPGRSYPQYVTAQKSVTYRTLRTRLPSGLIDLALVHPQLTVAEDRPKGFYLLTYEAGLPTDFFGRLNKSLSIPLKPEWATWLWKLGQQAHSRLTLSTRSVWEQGQEVEKTELIETTETPISRLDSLGTVACYRVQCGGRYKDAWLHLIRARLKLATPLQKEPQQSGKERYSGDGWRIVPTADGWSLLKEGEEVLQAPSLNYLLTEARERLGVHFVLAETRSGTAEKGV